LATEEIRQRLNALGAEPLTGRGKWGRPIIPTKSGALAGLLESAPVLLNNANRLVDNLNEVLDEDNRRELKQLLGNLNSTTKAFEARAPEIAETLVEAKTTLRQAGAAADKVGRMADATNLVVTEQGAALVTDIRGTTARANIAFDSLSKAADAAEPGLRDLSDHAIPEATALVRDLRQTNSSLGSVAGRLDEDPFGTLLGGRQLPDYEPEKAP